MHTSKNSENFLLNAVYNTETSQNLLRVSVLYTFLMKFPITTLIQMLVCSVLLLVGVSIGKKWQKGFIYRNKGT